jgi:hypothetical protein
MHHSFILPTHGREKAISLACTALKGLDEGVAWRVSIEPFKLSRTLSQNAYLWGVCYSPMSERSGYEAAELHEYLLGEFYGWVDKRVPKKPSNPHGKESVPRRTTTTDEKGKRAALSTKEFADYVDFVQRFAAEKLLLVIPDPDAGLVRR